MAFRTFANLEEATTYADGLNSRWPDRATVVPHISSLLRATASTHVVELCAGAGALAQQLFQDHPQITYTGIDLTVPLLTVARNRLVDQTSQITWLEADLNETAWLTQITKPVNAFMSLQSIHDLGDDAAVARILRLVAQQLAPQGQFIYADLLKVEPAEEKPNPGKLSVERHLELLHAAGFTTVKCTQQQGAFGCFYAEVA